VGDEATLEARRKAVSEWVGKMGIDPNRVWSALNIAGPADIGLEHLNILTGLKTALKDKEVSLDEAFPPLATDTEKASGTEGLKARISKSKAKDTPPDPMPEKGNSKHEDDPLPL
jgi:hypothetical protein